MTISASVGNLLEFYNFTAYMFFSPMIAQAFFPAANHITGLLLALSTFALGFVTRPIGAILMGYYETRFGRRDVLFFTFSLMGLGTAVLAFTPSYRSIGLLAPVLVMVARLLQGFSEGGEMGPATTLLLDLAPAQLRPHFASLQFLTQILAGLAAVIVGAGLAGVLPHAQLYAWGWRVPFMLGLTIVPLGIFLRWRMVELPVHPQPAVHQRDPGPVPARSMLCIAALTLTLLSAGTIGNYVRLYGVSYAIVVLHLPPITGMLAMASGLVAALVAILAGLRLGRLIAPRLLLILSAATGILLTYPAYILALAYPGLPTQLLLNVIIAGTSMLPTAFVMLAVLEALPKQRRSAQFGLLYALSISLFGGSTQPAITWLIRETGNALVPCWVLIGTSIITVWAALQLNIGRVAASVPADERAGPLAKPII